MKSQDSLLYLDETVSYKEDYIENFASSSFSLNTMTDSDRAPSISPPALGCNHRSSI